MDPKYENLIRSGRVTPATRAVLLNRASSAQSEDLPAYVLAEADLALPAVMQRLVPQSEGPSFVDIATELSSRRRNGVGDGWRYANMPPDHAALVRGLECLEQSAHTLHGVAFASLDGSKQDALLTAVQNGDVDWRSLDARRWFEDLLAEATEIFVSHPSTLSAMGFSGIAFLPRWTEIGVNSTQPWEPRAATRQNSDDPK